MGEKVERIRERGKSGKAFHADGINNSGTAKPVVEKLVASSEVNLDFAGNGSFEEIGKTDAKGSEALQGENQKLKEMVEKILNDQKKMEIVLNSLSEANAEMQQGLLSTRFYMSANICSQCNEPDRRTLLVLYK